MPASIPPTTLALLLVGETVRREEGDPCWSCREHEWGLSARRSQSCGVRRQGAYFRPFLFSPGPDADAEAAGRRAGAIFSSCSEAPWGLGKPRSPSLQLGIAGPLFCSEGKDTDHPGQ